MIRVLPKVACTALMASLLAACGSSGGGGFTSGTTISGTVRVTRSTVLRSKASAPSAAADLGGLTSAGAGVTVQLVRLNSQGQDPAVLATTTTDSSGGYSFVGANIPAPATTLAVQVAGQSTNMEALVIGAQVDITPASEAVFEVVTGTSGLNLANFTLNELAALDGVVLGTGLDVSSDDFADAVTALKAAAGDVLTTLATQFAAGSPNTVLQNKSYNTLAQISTLSAAPSIGLATDSGEGVIDLTNAMATGSLEAVYAPLTDNLSAANGDALEQGAAGGDVDLKGWIHIPTATGQLVESDTSGNGGIGAINAENSFMVYPLTGNALSGGSYSTLTRGLRFVTAGYTPAGPGAGTSSQFSNSDLDGGNGTTYHLLQLSQTLASNSGLHFNSGDQVTVGTATGDVVLSSATAVTLNNQPYGSLGANSLTTDSLSLDLSSGLTSSQPGTGSVGTSGANYSVNAFGNLTLLDNAANYPSLGVGNVVSGGEIFIFALTPDDVQSPPFPATINGVGTHTLDVAIRQDANPVTLAAGTYNVVEYADYLRTGTVVGSGYQTGTVTIDGNDNISGGTLTRSEGDINVPAALADPTTALSTSASTAPNTVASGTITLSTGSNTASLNANFGSETLTGNGAVTASGEIAVFAIDIADSNATDIGRGLLFLIRQR